MTKLLLKDEVYRVVGAAIEVHRELGPGFLESVYQEALELEMNIRGIPFEAQKQLEIYYKGQTLDQMYFADFLCYNSIVVEIKALARLSGTEQAQILNYLKATGHKVGILIYFGSQSRLEWKRFIN